MLEEYVKDLCIIFKKITVLIDFMVIKKWYISKFAFSR